MRRRKTKLSRLTSAARRNRIRRSLETESQKALRLLNGRMRSFYKRLTETEEQREIRLAISRESARRRKLRKEAKEKEKRKEEEGKKDEKEKKGKVKRKRRTKKQCAAEDLGSLFSRHQHFIFGNNFPTAIDQTFCGMPTNPALNPVETIQIENCPVPTETTPTDNVSLEGLNKDKIFIKLEKEGFDTVAPIQRTPLETSLCHIKTEIDVEEDTFRTTDAVNIKQEKNWDNNTDENYLDPLNVNRDSADQIVLETPLVPNIKEEPNWDLNKDSVEVDPLQIDVIPECNAIVQFEKPAMCNMETGVQAPFVLNQFNMRTEVGGHQKVIMQFRRF